MLGSSPTRRPTIRRSPSPPWSSTPPAAAGARWRHRSPSRSCRPSSACARNAHPSVMLRIDRRLIAHIEWPLLFLALIVTSVGLVTILSATHHSERLLSPYVIRQASFLGLALVVMVLAIGIDYRSLNRYG